MSAPRQSKKKGNAPPSSVAQSEQKPNKPPPPDALMQTGIVKAVTSGDTVTLLEVDDVNHRQVKITTFTLIGLKVPQFAKRTPDGVLSNEEPFAWQSREFLRKLVIGQPVVYCVEHSVGERKYGELWTHDQLDVRYSIVSSGWADVIVKPPRKGKNNQDLEPSYAQVELDKALQKAKEDRKGIWSNHTKDAVRTIKVHDVYRDVNTQELYSDELFEFYRGIKDKRHLKGIVEAVKNGTSYTIYLPDTMDKFPLLLSGVRLPSKKGADESEAEQLTRESKFYAEYFLLHRDVIITIDGVDKLNIFGTITCGEINIARSLLEMGLVLFVDWSAPKDSNISDSYRKAEKFAQEKRRKIWHDHSPVPKHVESGQDRSGTKETNITGTVIEVVNSSTITVRVSKADANNAQKTVDRIITLSSIRAPRMVKQEEEYKVKYPASMPQEEREKLELESKKKKEEEEEEIKREMAIAQEAKEFLRNALIGKKVKCIFDYPRSFATVKSQPPQVRLYWSVYITEGTSEKNIAVELVKLGLARVVSHPEDELRATDYQDLVVSEKNAEATRKGIHGAVYRQQNYINLTPAPKATESTDKSVAETKTAKLMTKCKQFFAYFQNKPRVEAIVDYVFAASRFKLTVPSQGCVIMFTLQGCIVDRPVKVAEDIAVKPDISPFDKQYPPTSPGNKALHFARDQVYQRKVHVSVTALDNFGNFLGHLFINNKDFTLTLIEQGHARLHYKIAKKFQNFEAFKAAEEKARKQLKGLWETWDFEKEAQQMAASSTIDRNPVAATATAINKEPYPILVTDIRSGNSFSYQIQNEETAALTELSANLQNEQFATHSQYTPPKGETVAAQFTMDDLWYRAEIMSLLPKGKDVPPDYEVRFIDYGNREILPSSRIRKLDPEYINLMSPQAYDAKLVGVKTPDEENAKDAIEGFKELVSGRTLYALEISTEKTSSKESKNPQVIYNVILTDKDKDLGLELIANGVTRVDKKLKEDDPLYALYHEAEEYAKRERYGLWQYGYNPDSDEEREIERQLLR